MWYPKFDPRNPCEGGRKEPTPQSCSLFTHVLWCIFFHTPHTHTHTNEISEKTNIKKALIKVIHFRNVRDGNAFKILFSTYLQDFCWFSEHCTYWSGVNQHFALWETLTMSTLTESNVEFFKIQIVFRPLHLIKWLTGIHTQESTVMYSLDNNITSHRQEAEEVHWDGRWVLNTPNPSPVIPSLQQIYTA